jgi:hypothetical protein
MGRANDDGAVAALTPPLVRHGMTTTNLMHQRPTELSVASVDRAPYNSGFRLLWLITRRDGDAPRIEADAAG